jgi:outer membrane protein assembly factor BamB
MIFSNFAKEGGRTSMPYKCRRKTRLVIGMTLASCLFVQSAALALDSSTTLTPVFDIPKIDVVQPISPTTNVGNASGIWAYPTRDFITANYSPAVGPAGTVYVGFNYYALVTLVGSLSAVSSEGKKKWEYILPDYPLMSPPTAGPDGTLYAGAGRLDYNEGNFIALNPDGTVKWSVSIGPVSSRPVFGADGTVYVAVRDGTLHALHPSDGSEKWATKPGITTTAYMAIGPDGTLYIGNDSDTFYAVKPNGAIKWTYETGGVVNTVPAIGSDGTIYVGAADRKLYAISPNGKKEWDYDLGGTPYSPIVGADGTIYVGAADQTVYALHPNNSLKWKTAFQKAITPVALGPNETVHFLTADGMIQALNLSDGSLQWRYGISTPDQIIAPSVGEDGTVYAIGMAKTTFTLYAFRVKITGIALNKSQTTLEVGASERLSAALSPGNASDRKVNWSSSNPGAATVDGSGNVTAVSAGNTTITAKANDGGRIATCEVTVPRSPGTIDADSVTVSPAELSVQAGKSVRLKAAVQPVDASNQKVAWSSSNTGVARVNESGQVTGVAPGTAVVTVQTADGGFIAASKITVLPGTGAPVSDIFSDIDGHWASGDIATAYERHIVNGYPDFTFRPDGSVTRAEFVVMLMNGLKPDIQGTDTAFEDKEDIGIWAQHAISQAVQLGIVNGYPDGTFRPGANITHAEMAAAVFHASGIPLAAVGKTAYTDDAAIPEWARGAVSSIEKKGIIVVGGKTSGPFAPTSLSTRAEAATWIVRMLEVKDGQ